LLTGKQDEMHLYTVKGQQAEYARLNKPIKEDGWYVVPGKIDAPCYGLLVMFVFSIVMLWGINAFTDNAPMLINFMRGCSILVATACIGYMGYSLLSPKRKVAVKQAN
ncbi:sodium transporter, partial [Vibrio parahaemolyticus]|nr:sodium transporter [Vibrio parahaemolyticus]